MRQRQFLEVLDRDEAERRWWDELELARLPDESVPLEQALGRVLAEDVRTEVDVPGFDRSNMDGFAVRAEDTFGATEEEPVRLRCNEESIPTGVAPRLEVRSATTTRRGRGARLKEVTETQSTNRGRPDLEKAAAAHRPAARNRAAARSGASWSHTADET